MRIVLRIVVAALVLALLAVVAATAFVYLEPETATRWAMDAQRRRAGLVRKQLTLAEGHPLVYLEGGRGAPLLLLHGFGANKDHFDRVARALTPHYRVIVPDLLGFGESARPPQADYSPTAQAERMHAFMQQLGIGQVHLGGSSMGGQIALAYAAAHPDEVQSLWLLDSGGIMSAPESEVRRLIRETGVNLLLARNEDEYAQTFAVAMSDPPFVPRPMLNVMARERIANAELEKRIFSQIAAEPVEKRIAGLAIPTLVVWGAEDRVLSVGTTDVIRKLMPQAKVIVMAGVGHLPMLEHPARVASDYLRFRASLKMP